MNKCYCIYCKSENNKKDKNCRVCNRKLKPLDELYLNYLKDYTKDKVKGDILDNVTDFVKEFIKSHLYGIIMSITIISVVTGNIIVNNNISSDKIVSVKPTLNVSSYTNYEDIIWDFLTSLSNLESISKYSYSTYFNQDNSIDYTNDLLNSYKKIEGYNHYEEFNLMAFNNEDLRNDSFKNETMIDIDLYDDFKVLSFEFHECINSICSINGIKNYDEVSIEELRGYYFIWFVKKDNNWYYLKTIDKTVPAGGTDYGGMIFNKKVYNYDEAWKREENL